jgi:hypothetical protein
MRYKKGELKPGLENSLEALKETNFRVTVLVFGMRGVKHELLSFLAKRRQRRLAKRMLERRRRKGTG